MNVCGAYYARVWSRKKVRGIRKRMNLVILALTELDVRTQTLLSRVSPRDRVSLLQHPYVIPVDVLGT
jgi:hypothetical protein